MPSACGAHAGHAMLRPSVRPSVCLSVPGLITQKLKGAQKPKLSVPLHCRCAHFHLNGSKVRRTAAQYVGTGPTQFSMQIKIRISRAHLQMSLKPKSNQIYICILDGKQLICMEIARNLTGLQYSACRTRMLSCSNMESTRYKPEEVRSTVEFSVPGEASFTEASLAVDALDAADVPGSVENVQQEPVDDWSLAAGTDHHHCSAGLRSTFYALLRSGIPL